ncbi:hypothetical protein M885DRAFT_451969, partial [Pelagophyceae sp. CCMP2097]
DHDDCSDSPVWHKAGKPTKDCAWAAKDTARRCTRVGKDGTTAAASCAKTCGSCDAGPEAEAVPEAEAAPDGCSDSSTWYKAGKPTKDCDWAAKDTARRCDRVGDDDTTAAASCAKTCGSCEAAPEAAAAPEADAGPEADSAPETAAAPEGCSGVWAKIGKTYKGCAWVAKDKANRCSLEGSDGALASDVCCEC